MIYSSIAISPEQVSRHYDELDLLYRKIWGEHVHHGLFESRNDSKEEATKRLSHKVAQLAGLRPGDKVCDIGCGYGATSQLLADLYGAEVLGLTISPAQFEIAKEASSTGKLQFRLLDWLQNDLGDEAFDHLISIESSEHMPDKKRFFSEAQRVLKPGGRFVICAWLSGSHVNPWENKLLLEPICREGRLPSMGTKEDYGSMFRENGFRLVSFLDITESVKRTWTLVLTGLARHFANHPSDLKLLWPRWNQNADFFKSLFRIRWAYESGAMKYGIFVAEKPAK